MDRFAATLSRRLAAEFLWSREQEEIAAFSLTLVFSTLFLLGLLVAGAASLGALPEALVMAVSSGALRVVAGGAHFSTGWRCGAVSAALATGVAALVARSGSLLERAGREMVAALALLVGLLAAAVMARFAPVDVPEKPIGSPAKRRRLRRFAIGLSVGWGAGSGWLLAGEQLALTYGVASALGVLWETFSVLPLGGRAVRRLDQWFDSLRAKGGVSR